MHPDRHLLLSVLAPFSSHSYVLLLLLTFTLVSPLLSSLTLLSSPFILLMLSFDLFCFVIWLMRIFLFLLSYFVRTLSLLPLSRDNRQALFILVPFSRQTASDSCAHHPVRPRAIGARHKRRKQSSISFSSLSAAIFTVLLRDLCLFLLPSFACHSVAPLL